MRKNILLSIRHLLSNKANSLINLLGLVLGLTVVTIVTVFVINETGYNKSFKNYNKIYRVLNNDNTNLWANTPFVLGETIYDNFAEVETYAHQYNIPQYEIFHNDNFLLEEHLLCTESSFFDMFGVDIIEGDLQGFDEVDNKILINKDIAERYYGDETPLGKLIKIKLSGEEYEMEVIGVFNNFKSNVTIKASVITNSELAFKHLRKTIITVGNSVDFTDLQKSWTSSQFFTNYILLKEDADIDEFSKKLAKLGEDYSNENLILKLSLQPLRSIYFNSENIFDNNNPDKGNTQMLFILISVGFLILFIAFINYLNLTTAQMMTQTKSLAIQSICGASRSGLIAQMIFESTLISLIALPIAMFLASSLFPWISILLNKSYELTLSSSFLFVLVCLILITTIMGVLSGLIISVRTTSFNLVEVLKNKIMAKSGKRLFSKVMVVFQIVIFIILISSMIIMNRQINYAFNMDIGINKEGLIKISAGDVNYDVFKQKIQENPDVISISRALWVPPFNGKMMISTPKANDPSEMAQLYYNFVDYDFVETMGIKVLDGKGFDIESSVGGALVNEATVNELGITEVIGHPVVFGKIVGVISDFNMYSIYEPIPPMVIVLNPKMVSEIAIKLNTNNIKNTINYLEKAWSESGATTPFNFQFIDDVLNQFYRKDIRFSRLIGISAFVAILITCMGLFGLSLLMSKQKTKEIGMRKINGATEFEIIKLLNSGVIIQVLIAFVIAVPISWYLMTKWLDNFVFKTNLNIWIFLLAGLLALVITLITVSWQSWRAAMKNPVEALKYE
ncbi:MAG: ABC transporter permease [Bacteroidales bacterium]|jgi:putative ABC transport system permease protein|nr:ABC transporter permease [Bacteroidales bacterium]